MDTIFSEELETGLRSAIDGAGRAKYQGLANGLRQALLDKRLSSGDRLPAVRDLAWRLGVTPNTVARAYSRLTEEGLLTAGVGRGTFVADSRTPPLRRSHHRDAAPEMPPAPEPAAEEWPEIADLRSPLLPDVGQEALLRVCLARVATHSPPELFYQYPSRESDAPLRQAFRHWMGNAPIGPFDIDDVVVSHGGQSAIVSILQTILQGPEPVILVDKLTYTGYRRAAELVRARAISVPWDEEGPIPDALAQLARDHGAQAFCTSAEVCNPTALGTSARRRVEIARVARRFDMHILDDDCYRIGPHKGDAYRALLPDLGWYVTSPSKSLSPAFRIGFGLAPEGWAQQLVQISAHNSFGQARALTALFAEVLRDEKLPEITEDLRARINSDLRIALNHLGGHAVNWQSDVPLLWLELPSGWRAQGFCRAAEALGVVLKPGDEFAARDGRAVQAVRIALNGRLSQPRFEAAMATLRSLLDAPPQNITV